MTVWFAIWAACCAFIIAMMIRDRRRLRAWNKRCNRMFVEAELQRERQSLARQVLYLKALGRK